MPYSKRHLFDHILGTRGMGRQSKFVSNPKPDLMTVEIRQVQ